MKMERDLHYSSSSLPFPFSFINDLNDSNTNHEYDGTLHAVVPHLLTDFSIKTLSSSSSSSLDFPTTPTDHYDHRHHQSSAPSFNFFNTTTTTALIPLPTNLNYQPFYSNPLLDPADLTLPFDFFSKTTTTTDDLNFHCLPSLHSLESPPPPPPPPPSTSSSSRKRSRVINSVQNYTVSGPSNPAPVMPNSQLARLRRQKLSDKMRCLQKLMPWDKKMDTATMLDEAYKYIQFLQAQVFALQSMPCESSYISTTTATTAAAGGGDVVASHYNNNGTWASNHGGFAGGLWRLNRQQLLQVLVNSPVAQTMLYSRGFCVLSTEQLALLKEVASRREALQHFSTHGDSSGTS